MVLFDEDPVTLIAETTHQFRIAPDKDSLTRINSSHHTLGSARSVRLDDYHASLKSLSRRLNTLQSQHNYERDSHDAGRQAQEVLRLDTEKFRVAKGASEVEIEGERLGGELAGLKSQLAQLEREGVEGGGRRGSAAEEDESVLKLRVYRSLGIDLTQDQYTGEFTRAAICDPQKGDVTVINVDGKMSKQFYADLFWESL